MGKFITSKRARAEGAKRAEDDVVRERLWEFRKDGRG